MIFARAYRIRNLQTSTDNFSVNFTVTADVYIYNSKWVKIVGSHNLRDELLCVNVCGNDNSNATCGLIMWLSAEKKWDDRK